jgi:hypothetical protein
MFVVEKLGEDVWVAVAWEEGGEIFRQAVRRDQAKGCVRNQRRGRRGSEGNGGLRW